MMHGLEKAADGSAADIEDAAATVRAGSLIDEIEDVTFRTWTDVVPTAQHIGAPLPDPRAPDGAANPTFLAVWLDARRGDWAAESTT